MSKLEKSQMTKLGGKLWFSIILFGLIGQIAWIVENMYFAKFMQNNIEREPYATTLMVIFSALFATVATVIGGALCDRTGKRKSFICAGYILWGISTIAFALIPLDFSQEQKMKIVWLVVLMDCVMSFIGAIANDAAFNTWVTDISDTTNRGKVDTVLAVMPIAAMVVVFVGLDNLTADAGHWGQFFTILGLVPIAGGCLGLLMLKDSPNVIKQTEGSYWGNLLYSFRPTVVKSNKMLYVCLLGSMFSGASIQVFQAYLINIIEKTLSIENYIIPLGVVILLSAGLSVLLGSLMDKFGKDKFYYPVIFANIIGAVVLYFAKYPASNSAGQLALVIVGGTAVMGASLSMAGLFIASFRDYIPKGKEGSFQGVRMVLFVLIPMIIGPLVAQGIINTVNLRTADNELLYPMELFLGSAAVVALAMIPAYFMKKHDKAHRQKLFEQLQSQPKD